MTAPKPAAWNRSRHLNRLEQGRLFCHLGRNDAGEFSAWVWHDGGAIDGAHQPRTWVEGFEGRDESAIRVMVENAWPGIIYQQVRPYPAETMRVTVVDRARMDAIYGTPAFNGVVLRSVTISKSCPVCGEMRGQPRMERFHEWGMFYSVSMWRNDCGHVDNYADVLLEKLT